jgi:hypothetical protein
MVLAFSIPEFCEEHGLSRATLYRLITAGLGPAVMKVGARTFVSHEAAAEWRRAREGPVNSHPRYREAGLRGALAAHARR